MKNSHKNFSRARIPATSEGFDENGKSYREMGLDLRSPSKPATKNFMSPTVSATSKANPPRKKVLAERNQILDSPLQKTPNIYSKSTQKTPVYDSRAASMISGPGTTEFGSNNSDLRPYDPLTNYLSPRPEFLRYKPNRLREILLRMENKDEESSDESGLGRSVSTEAKPENDDETDSLHASQETSLKKENEELELSYEELEEEEEVKEGKTCFLKFLLVLVVLVFSTSYIYYMNSPTPSPPATQAIQEWQYRMHLVYGMVVSFEGERGVFNSQRDLIGLNHTVIGYDTLAEEMVEDVIRGLDDKNECSEVEEVQAGKFELMQVVKYELVEEEAEVICEDTCDLKMDTVEISNVKNEYVEVESGKIEENIGVVDVYDRKIEESGSSVHQQIDLKDENIVVMADHLVEEQAGLENIEVVLAEQVEEQAGVREVASDLKMNTGELSYKKIENVELESGLVEDGFLMNPLKEVVHEELNQEAIEEKNIDFWSHEVEGSLEEEEAVEDMETESISSGVICVALFSLVSASLTLSFCFKKARKVRLSSPSVFVPAVEPVVEEKCCLVVPDKEQKQVDSVDLYAKRLHSVDFRKVVSENSYQTRAPSIELLSEFEVGSISSPVRSGGMKGRMIDSRVSSHYVSQEKELGSTGDSVPVQAQPELSAMNPPSFGSYTAEKKILRKQKLEGGNDEHKIVMTTPVRRSTRISSRAVTSP